MEENEEQPMDNEGSSTEQNFEEESDLQCEVEKSVSLGKFKNIEALVEAYSNLQKEFTKKCQLLSEFQKDKINQEKEVESSLNQKLEKFLKENSDAENYIDEIKSMVAENDELKKEDDPYGHAFAEMVFNSLKKPNKSQSKIIENYVLNDEEIKKLILENYMTELNLNKSPKIISSTGGERVPPQQVSGTPTTLKEAKKLVQDMFS